MRFGRELFRYRSDIDEGRPSVAQDLPRFAQESVRAQGVSIERRREQAQLLHRFNALVPNRIIHPK
jgi:hypothetical protein